MEASPSTPSNRQLVILCDCRNQTRTSCVANGSSSAFRNLNVTMKPPLDLSILVISYNTRETTLACLRSVCAQTRSSTFELILVDNASVDGSVGAIAGEFPQATLIQNRENQGFARANNLAASAARGEFLLLLNPDTLVLDGAIDRILAFTKADRDSGIVGGRTLFADRSLNPASCWGAPTLWSAFCEASGVSAIFRSSPIFNREAMPDWGRDNMREVDIVSGCFMLVRTDVWRTLGGFDTRFHMYGEDADLCMRARKAGYRCLICPDATIIHLGGASEPVKADKMVRLFTAKAQLFAAHWRPTRAWLGVRTLDLWALTRLAAYSLAGIINCRYAKERATWRAIWSRRRLWSLAAVRSAQSSRGPATEVGCSQPQQA